MSLSKHPAALPDDDLLAQCSFRATRRSGPGGQHRNKVETAVILTHEASGVRAEANERRSQVENREVALHRLRLALALEVRHPAGELSERWKDRVAKGKLKVSLEHQDYPVLLAELLDHYVESPDDLPALASVLGTTSSQLVKFLKTHPPAFAWVNRHRTSQGKHPLQ